jgi:hypothetical protein
MARVPFSTVARSLPNVSFNRVVLEAFDPDTSNTFEVRLDSKIPSVVAADGDGNEALLRLDFATGSVWRRMLAMQANTPIAKKAKKPKKPRKPKAGRLVHPTLIFTSCAQKDFILPENYACTPVIPEHFSQCEQVNHLFANYFELKVPFHVLSTYAQVSDVDLCGIVIVSSFSPSYIVPDNFRIKNSLASSKARDRATGEEGLLELDFAMRSVRFRDSEVFEPDILYGARIDPVTTIPSNFVLQKELVLEQTPNYPFERALKKAFLEQGQKGPRVIQLAAKGMAAKGMAAEGKTAEVPKSEKPYKNIRHGKYLDTIASELANVAEPEKQCLLESLYDYQFSSSSLHRQIMARQGYLYATQSETKTAREYAITFLARLPMDSYDFKEWLLKTPSENSIEKLQRKTLQSGMRRAKRVFYSVGKKNLPTQSFATTTLNSILDGLWIQQKRLAKFFFLLASLTFIEFPVELYDLCGLYWLASSRGCPYAVWKAEIQRIVGAPTEDEQEEEGGLLAPL